MLVCNVALRPPRAGIAADIAEAADAVDAAATGNVVFATLVDDPASVGDLVDAYLGEIMLEAASADTVLDASIPATFDADVAETATAADTADATSIVNYATFDGTKSANITLSNGDLTATNSTGAGDTGVQSLAYKSTGKYYFEIKRISTSGGGGACQGLITATGTYADLASNGTNCTVVLQSSAIMSNNAATGKTIGSIGLNDVVCAAIDLGARKAWFRKNGGNWNGEAIGLQDPANGIGGVTMQASVAFTPAVGFNSFTSGQAQTGNFGASAFAFTVPSGFTSGWPG